MKKLVTVFACALLLCTASFAADRTNSTSNLGSVWKTYKHAQPTVKSDNMVMGYAGADVDHNATLA